MAKWHKLTDAELELLGVLWTRGPSTVREVYEGLPKDRQKGYTTVLKMLQLMNDKGLVRRDEDSRAHVYSAAVAADQTRSGIVKDLAQRVFGGSSTSLALNALGADYKPEQLEEIRALLDKLEKS